MGGQALGAAAQLAPAVLAVEIARHSGLSPALIGVFSGLVFLAAATSALGGGGLIGRYGAVAAVRVGAAMSAIGTALVAIGHPAAIAFAALVIGLGYGPMTPASSVVLSRWAPAHRLGLIMSIKQTGVPMGYFATGVLLPRLSEAIGWQTSLLALAALTAVAAVALTPAARLLDEKRPGVRSGFASARHSLGLLRQHPRLRRIAFASLAFAGVQVTVVSFLVVYLEDFIGLEKQLAAWPLAVAGVAAIAGRIAWGWLADTVAASRLLVVLPALLAATVAAFLAAGAGWGLAPLTALGLAVGLTVLAWNGVMLIETARQAPPGEVGLASSGVLALTFLGSTIFPQLLSATVGATGSYQGGFIAMTVVCAIVILAYLPDAIKNK